MKRLCNSKPAFRAFTILGGCPQVVSTFVAFHHASGLPLLPCEAVGGGVFPADFVSDWVVGVEVEELEEHFPVA